MRLRQLPMVIVVFVWGMKAGEVRRVVVWRRTAGEGLERGEGD